MVVEAAVGGVITLAAGGALTCGRTRGKGCGMAPERDAQPVVSNASAHQNSGRMTRLISTEVLSDQGKE